MAAAIQIKRSANVAAPTTTDLAASELAYSQDVSNDGSGAILYIESIDVDNNPVIHKIGGKYYTLMLDNATHLSNVSTIVLRDELGDFKARRVTATLFGVANSALFANVALNSTTSNSALSSSISNTANAWTTPRSITLSGDASGNVTLDGSANVTLEISVVGGTGNSGNANVSLYAVLAERANSATISNLANVALFATNATNSNVALVAAFATNSENANIAQQASFASLATLATKSNSTDLATLANVASFATLSNSANIATNANNAINATTSNFATLANSANIATNANNSINATVSVYSTLSEKSNSTVIANNANNSINATIAVSALSATIADTSNAWTVARNIQVLGDAVGNVSINGSANANLTLDIGYAETSNVANTSSYSTLSEKSNSTIIANSANIWTTPRTIHIIGDAAGSVTIDGSSNANLSLSITNVTNSVSIADTANAWTTPRSITLSGDASGNVTLDGSANVTLTTTVISSLFANSSAIANNANNSINATTSNFATLSNSANIATNANNAINATTSNFATLANSANIATNANNSINATIALSAVIANSAVISNNANNAINATISLSAIVSNSANIATNANNSINATISLSAIVSNSANIANSSNTSLFANLSQNSNVAVYAILAETSNTAILAATATFAANAESSNNTEFANVSNLSIFSSSASSADFAESSNVASIASFATSATNSTFATSSETANTSSYSTLSEKSNSTIIANSANIWTTPRTLTLTGDVGGSVQIDGSSNISLSTTVDFANVVINLGSNTVGNYVNNVIAGTGITVTGQGGEAANVTVSLPNTSVTAGTYGGTTAIPVIVVDAQGRLTSAGNASISTDLLIAGNVGSDTVSVGEILRVVGASGITTNVISNTISITNTGVTSLTGTTNQITVNASTGAITLSLPNDITTPGSLTVSGNLNVLGNIVTTNFSTLSIDDSIIRLANNNITTDVLDIGFYGEYNNGGVKYAGLVRDASDGIFKLFKDTSTEPSNVVNFSTVVKGTLDTNITGGNVSGLYKAITVSDGGTGNTTYTTNSVVIASGTNAFKSVSGTEGQTLQIISGTPTFRTVNEAPADVEFIVGTANVLVPSARVIAGGNNITIDKTIANNLIIKREALTGAITSPANSNVTTLSSNVVLNTNMFIMPPKSVKVNIASTSNAPSDFQFTGTSKVLGVNDAGNIDQLSFNSSFSITGNTVALVNGSLLYGNVDPTTQGLNNDFYYNNANSTYFGPKVAGSWPTVGVNLKGKPGWEYIFTVATTNFDPSSTKIRFNSATASSITIMRISISDLALNDRTQHLNAIATNGMIDIVSSSATGTTNLRLQTTGNAAPVGGTYYNVPVVWVAGGIPGSLEPISILYTPGPNIQWDDTNKVLKTASGVEISNPLTYDTQFNIPLPNVILNKAAIVKNNGFPYAIYSDGNNVSTLGVERLHSYSSSSVRKIILPSSGLTWVASNNLGKVRITTSGNVAHNLSTANTVVSGNVSKVNIKVVSGTGWTANSFHEIVTVGASTIDLNTDYVSQGVPVVVGANTEVDILELVLPKLKENSGLCVKMGIGYAAVTTNRRVKSYLGGVLISENNQTSANKYTPFEVGFNNQGLTNLQKSLHGLNSTGLVSNLSEPVETNIETSVGNVVFKVAFLIASPDVIMEMHNYFAYLRGV